jgi:hypothetical protein
MIINSKYLVSWLCWAMFVAASVGCSTLDSLGLGKGAPAPGKGGAVAASGVYYTGSDDLTLYRKPGDEILTRLPIHTRLYRDELKSGYAHVRVAPSGETGWVENARLIWRLPAQAAQPPAAAEPAAAQPAPAAVVPSSDTPQPTVAPSIFNPY